MQTYNAKQTAFRTGRLRSREPGSTAEDVLEEMGIHFYAGGSSSKVRNKQLI